MTVADIMTAIGSVGFPIFACCYMFYIYQNSQIDHNNSLKEVRDAIQKLELAINTLIAKLDS